MTRTIIILLSFFVFIASFAQAQNDEPDLEQAPRFGVTAMSEHSWSRWSPNYATVNMNGNTPINNSILISLDNCGGYTYVEPLYRVFWYRDSIHEQGNLRIFFNGYNSDTVLLIHHDDGSWWCNDNAFSATNNPMIEIDSPRTGNYYIWIGTHATGISINGRLYFNFIDSATPAGQQYDPNTYPPNSSQMPPFIGQGSGTIGSRFIYIACMFDSTGVKISTDVVVDNLNGDERLRLAVTYNGRVYTSNENRISRPGSFNFDYSGSGQGPLETFISESNIRNLNLSLTVQSQARGTTDWINLISPAYAFQCNR